VYNAASEFEQVANINWAHEGDFIHLFEYWSLSTKHVGCGKG
jgi:hypothetical protein